MVGVSATAPCSPATPARITKHRSFPARSPPKPKRANICDIDKYFWFTDVDGTIRQAVSANNQIPQQVNDYIFVPSTFEDAPCPSTLASGGVWPPQTLGDLISAIGSEYTTCVGNTHYDGNMCRDPDCDHTLDEWAEATQDWKRYFELRMTDSRGIGVFTKHDFHKGDILGWYTGELQVLEGASGDYLVEIEIGDIAAHSLDPNQRDHLVYINGERKGNWTRFINHSCDADAVFRIMRVGNIRVMTVEAVRDVPSGKELNVSYGQEYYGMTTEKRCACGVAECVEKRRSEEKIEKRKAEPRRSNVKKCKRMAPPILI